MGFKIASFFLITSFTSFSFLSFAAGPDGDGKETAKEFFKVIASPKAQHPFSLAKAQRNDGTTEVLKLARK